jgi:beta-glucosidase-like glycosyl hydrolase
MRFAAILRAYLHNPVRFHDRVASRFGLRQHIAHRLFHIDVLAGFYAPADRSIPLYNMQARAVALEAARSGMVLLKNERDLLPFRKDELKTLAVIGPSPVTRYGSIST